MRRAPSSTPRLKRHSAHRPRHYRTERHPLLNMNLPHWFGRPPIIAEESVVGRRLRGAFGKPLPTLFSNTERRYGLVREFFVMNGRFGRGGVSGPRVRNSPILTKASPRPCWAHRRPSCPKSPRPGSRAAAFCRPFASEIRCNRHDRPPCRDPRINGYRRYPNRTRRSPLGPPSNVPTTNTRYSRIKQIATGGPRVSFTNKNSREVASNF